MMYMLLAALIARLFVLLIRAAYGTPTDPVSGTIITVAYAVANFLNPIRALRAFTGGADPPGSGYVVTSDSVSATTWKTTIAVVAAAIGYTPLNKAGDTITPGGLNIAGALVIGGSTTAGAINAGAISGSSLVSAGAVSIGGTTTAGVINAGAISGSTGTFSAALSALSGAFTNAVTAASATLSGALSAASAAISGNATVGGTLGVTGIATFTAQPLVGAEIISRVKVGSYVGNGGSGVSIAVGFAPKLVVLTWTSTSGNDSGSMNIISTTAGTTVAHGNFGGSPTAGIVDSAVLSGTNFLVYGSGGAFNAFSNIGTATTTYRWTAYG